MKKIGITLLTAFIGGAVAVGGYKLIETKYTDTLSLDERQKVYFTNNPVNIAPGVGAVDFVEAASVVTPGVVHIKTTYENRSGSQEGSDPFADMFGDMFGSPRGGGRMRSMPQMASGSGVIVTGDGYIITNNHVVENATKIEVVMPDKRSFQAKVIGRDPNTDLALIKVSAAGLPIVKLGNSDNVQIGEWVLAVGYPLSLNSTVTAGIVSAKGRSIGILREHQQQPRGYGQQEDVQAPSSTIESFIQTDAAINPGNSGGALVNTRGELIGINSAIASQSGGYEGYGFAIPVNLAKKIMDDFIQYGTVKRGYLGVTFPSPESEAGILKDKGLDPSTPGVFITGVQKGSAAEVAGLKEGDIVRSLDGAKVNSSSEFAERIARRRPGDKVQLNYFRNGTEHNTAVTLKGESSVKIASNVNTAEANKILSVLGGNFASLTPAQKQRYRVSSGVAVVGARQGGLLFENSITKGTIITQINGKPVNKVEDVEAAVVASQNNMMRIDGVTSDGARFMVTFPVLQ